MNDKTKVIDIICTAKFTIFNKPDGGIGLKMKVVELLDNDLFKLGDAIVNNSYCKYLFASNSFITVSISDKTPGVEFLHLYDRDAIVDRDNNRISFSVDNIYLTNINSKEKIIVKLVFIANDVEEVILSYHKKINEYEEKLQLDEVARIKDKQNSELFMTQIRNTYNEEKNNSL